MLEGFSSSEGVGYWLGVVGGSLMLLTLLYPIRKRWSLLQNFGSMRVWFLAHIFAGVFGPILVLLHTGFYFGSMNAIVATVSMVAVFLSGLAGRYILRHLTSLEERHGDVGGIVLWRKAFSLWHLIHIPFLWLLFFSGIVHVVAVHMY